jgi:hypothetical protein
VSVIRNAASPLARVLAGLLRQPPQSNDPPITNSLQNETESKQKEPPPEDEDFDSDE